MIYDQETNFVYISGRLSERYPAFFEELSEILNRESISFGLLPHTNDIWCRDYMPVQVSKDRFVQFKYMPIYLQGSKKKKNRETITDANDTCAAIGIAPELSDIKIDGGNIIKSKMKVVMTERIFAENPGYSREGLLGGIKHLLEMAQIIIIPEDPKDELGHADGMVRFLDETTVIVNAYSQEDEVLSRKVISTLEKNELKMMFAPYTPYQNKSDFDATGIYINYLHVGKLVVYPIYGIEEDEEAHKFFTELFGSNAVPIRANAIAKEGGVLNCVSWGVRI